VTTAPLIELKVFFNVVLPGGGGGVWCGNVSECNASHYLSSSAQCRLHMQPRWWEDWPCTCNRDGGKIDCANATTLVGRFFDRAHATALVGRLPRAAMVNAAQMNTPWSAEERTLSPRNVGKRN
jgi:hypothetical protein